MIKTLKVLVTVASLFFITTSPVQANVIINEVFPNPVTGTEWVELYNTGNEAIPLTGWSLYDQLTSPSLLKTFTVTDTLPALSYLSIEISNKLNNSSDGLTLKKSAGDTIDTMTYTSSTPGQSWSRNGQVFVLTTPTRDAANTFPSPSPTPSPSPQVSPQPSPSPSDNVQSVFSLILTEVMACPSEEGTEWLELYNPTTEPMSIDSVFITDAASNVRLASLFIEAESYTSLEWPTSMLNNGGDRVSLTTDQDQTIVSAILPSCVKGQSLVAENGSWRLTTTPTRNQANVLTISAIPSPTTTAKSKPSPTANSAATSSPNITENSITPDQETAIEALITSYDLQAVETKLGTDSAALKLSIPPTPHFVSTTDITIVSSREISPFSIISVILGGGIISLTGLLSLYDSFHESLALPLAQAW